ncbi:MAG: glycosyltransferase family 4 protein [Candidatus Omnitrophica bacterium]|nr:glycosyltransferase family 4 protein [Candidatus Omnitrophota bacterium]
MNKNIINGQLNKYFNLDTISINTSRKLNEVEKLSLTKICVFFSIVSKLVRKLLLNRFCFCYFSLAPTGIAFYKDMIFVLLLRIFHVKRLYHLHGKGVSLKKDFLHKLLYKYCFNKSKVILVSQSLFYDIKDYIDKKNVFVLPNAIHNTLKDSEFEKIIKKRSFKERADLLFLSNITRNKGAFFALEAAQILKNNGLNFKFYFVGEWKDVSSEEFFDKVEQCNLKNEVKYLGFKTGKDKSFILEESDIFVYPTYNDIFGIVNLEAMEYGLPIISTDEGAIPEIVEDNVTGFIIPKKNGPSLSKKIETLIRDKQLRIKMGTQGRKKFLANYTFDKFEENLIDIFNKEISN